MGYASATIQLLNYIATKMQPKPYRWVGVGQMWEMGYYMIFINIFNTIKTTNIIWINQCLSLVPNMGVVACACLLVSVMPL